MKNSTTKVYSSFKNSSFKKNRPKTSDYELVSMEEGPSQDERWPQRSKTRLELEMEANTSRKSVRRIAPIEEVPSAPAANLFTRSNEPVAALSSNAPLNLDLAFKNNDKAFKFGLGIETPANLSNLNFRK